MIPPPIMITPFLSMNRPFRKAAIPAAVLFPAGAVVSPRAPPDTRALRPGVPARRHPPGTGHCVRADRRRSDPRKADPGPDISRVAAAVRGRGNKRNDFTGGIPGRVNVLFPVLRHHQGRKSQAEGFEHGYSARDHGKLGPGQHAGQRTRPVAPPAAHGTGCSAPSRSPGPGDQGNPEIAADMIELSDHQGGQSGGVGPPRAITTSSTCWNRCSGGDSPAHPRSRRNAGCRIAQSGPNPHSACPR